MQISCNWHVRFVEFGCSDVTNHKGAKGDSQYKLVFSPTTPRRNTGQKRSIPDDNTFTRKLFPKTMIAQQWLEKNHVQHTFLENLSSNWLFLAFNSHGCNGLYFRRSHVCMLTYTYIYIYSYTYMVIIWAWMWKTFAHVLQHYLPSCCLVCMWTRSNLLKSAWRQV